jgi:multidrug efflux pump subunit AcrA (membrane-fusion protein)
VRGWILRGLLALALVLIGVVGGAVWSERRALQSSHVAGRSDRGTSAAIGQAVPDLPPRSSSDGAEKAAPEEQVEISLTPEAVERAGIKTATARSETSRATVTVPGTVTSNAYRDTKVNALVGGIVRRVAVELGQGVRRGQDLAVIFSNELAEAQMKYLSLQAMLTADHQKLGRTEQLAKIGAASRQELEEITATHHAHETEVAAARQRLLVTDM